MAGKDLLKIALPVVVLSILAFFVLFVNKAPNILLDKKRKKLKITEITQLSPDTKRFRVSFGGSSTILGLPVGKHISIICPNPPSCLSNGTWNGKPDEDKAKAEIERKYTPTTGNETPGHVDLVIKCYRPGTVTMPDGRETKWADGGKLSLHLDSRKVGDTLDVNGPFGVNEYQGRGKFKVPGQLLQVKHVCMMAGGTGLTPMLQVVQAALLDPEDQTHFSLIYANKTETDILCRDLLEDAERRANGRFKLTFTLDFPPPGWQHKTGFITQDMIKEVFVPPSENPIILMCGPPPMVEFACKKNLEAIGYNKKSMIPF